MNPSENSYAFGASVGGDFLHLVRLGSTSKDPIYAIAPPKWSEEGK
jgi:hypothetical protein